MERLNEPLLSLIVLAAGKSTRMHGRNKLLIKIEGKHVIRRVVEVALSSKVDEVIVVLGWEAERVRKALDDLPCRFIVNKEYEKGQSSSVRVGLKGISESTEAVLILPGDIAKVDTSAINRVIEDYSRRKHPIIVAAYHGRPGHPILLDRELFKDIEQIDEQSFGLKAVTKKHEGRIRFIEAGSPNVLRDIDTPEDLKNL
jgi:molybdenum cofactor cytidylyltransferase